MRIGVEEDGTLELVYGGKELVRAEVRLEVREVVDRAPLGSTPLRQPRWNRSGFRPTVRVFVGVLQFSVMRGELAYHVEEGCVGEEGSPVYARMDARFKVFFFSASITGSCTSGYRTPRSTS